MEWGDLSAFINLGVYTIVNKCELIWTIDISSRHLVNFGPVCDEQYGDEACVALLLPSLHGQREKVLWKPVLSGVDVIHLETLVGDGVRKKTNLAGFQSAKSSRL